MMTVATGGTLRRSYHLLQSMTQVQTSHCISSLLIRPLSSCGASQSLNGAAASSQIQQQRSFGTYFDKKEADREYRTALFRKRQERAARLPTRREGKPKDVLKTQFRSWWDQRRKFELMLESKAKQSKLGWTIKVATIIERLPIILPDQPEWMKEYSDLRTYLNQFGKKYPKDLEPEPKEQVALTDEEVLALLPKGYTPAPRETEADHSGDVRTLNRRLKTRVYLTVQEDLNDKSYWGFPVAWVKEDETLLDASKRALEERVGPLTLHCPSNCPMAVNMSSYPPEKQKKLGKFGAKTFFMRLQYDDGKVDPTTMAAKDFAWLTRDEIVEKIRHQSGEYQSKFYHYLL